MSLPITNGFYRSKSLPLSHQECVNWYPTVAEFGGLSDMALFGTAGLQQLATTGSTTETNRGGHVKNGIPYFVNGNSLYRLDRDINPSGGQTFSMANLGTIPGNGRVFMADNGTQLMILVPGDSGYIYNESATPAFQQITDSDFTANGIPQHLSFIDGYFACTTDSKKWIVSALNNGLSWSALDFASAESDPDAIVASAVIQNQIFIMGSETTEGYANIGGSGFPFQRSNIYIDKGCYSAGSIVKADNTFFMIGGGFNESAAIWGYVGGKFEKRSTNAIDQILQGMTDIELKAAHGFSYAHEGAYFIGWTVGNYTIVYDLMTKRWHERKSFVNQSQIRWRVNSIVTAYGRVIVGDSVDGRIGELSPPLYTEYENNIIRVCTTQPFSNGGKVVKIPYIELTVESGAGNEACPDPVVGLSISNDGRTFGIERTRRIGPEGRYGRRVIWTQNGQVDRFAVLRFRMSDPVCPTLIKLEAE